VVDDPPDLAPEPVLEDDLLVLLLPPADALAVMLLLPIEDADPVFDFDSFGAPAFVMEGFDGEVAILFRAAAVAAWAEGGAKSV